MYIIIEGIDGSGKSTLASNMHSKLKEIEPNVMLTREPGSPMSPVTSQIRRLLKKEYTEQPVPLAELFLFMADRAHHYETVVKPKLKADWIVIQDRGFMSTVAYQGYGRGIDIDIIKGMNNMILYGRYPDAVILVDTPLDIAYNRIGGRSDDIEAFNALQFQEKVARGFQEMLFQSAVRVIQLDGTKSQEELCTEAISKVAELRKA